MNHGKLKKYLFAFKVPIYSSEILCFVGHSWQQVIQVLSSVKDAEDYIQGVTEKKDVGGLTVQRGDGNILIWLPSLPFGPEAMATSEHERRHATDLILSFAGMDHPRETSEAHCYLQGWIAQRMWEELQQYEGYSF